MRIAAPEGFEYSGVQSCVTASRRNRSSHVCFGLVPFTLPNMQLSSCAEEFDPVRRNYTLRGREDGDTPIQCPAGLGISLIGDVKDCYTTEDRRHVRSFATSRLLPHAEGFAIFGLSFVLPAVGATSQPNREPRRDPRDTTGRIDCNL